jgi:hypothetical protein
MNRFRDMEPNVKNFFKTTKEARPLYEWRKDGIYIKWGPWMGLNLTQKWIDNSEEVERFIENIMESDEAPIKLMMNTIDVYNYLKKNY